LTVGISAYDEKYAKNLRFHYANRDASELARVIIDTQGSPLYVDVRPQVLRDRIRRTVLAFPENPGMLLGAEYAN
jgi:hypothetical protein